MKIFCACPVYGDIHPATAHSIQRLEKESSHQFVVRFTRNNPYIDSAREYLFGRFLEMNKHHQFDYFWQLDQDVWFQPSAIDRIVSLQEDFVSGLYAFKTDQDWGKPMMAIADGARVDDRGLIRASRVPSGFFWARTKRLVKLAKKYPELRYCVPAGADTADPTDCWTYALWTGMIRKLPGIKYPIKLNEDYAFSTRLTDKGATLYVDTSIHLRHCIGEKFAELPFGDTPMEFVKREALK